MKDKELIGSGQEGLVYKLNDGTGLKVFWRTHDGCGHYDPDRREKHAEKEFENTKKAYNRGINVPEPYDLKTVELDEKDIEPINKLKYRVGGRVPHNETVSPETLLDEDLPALHRDFIEGETLYDRYIPDKRLEEKVESLHDDIEEANMMYPDVKAENYVLTDDDELYIVDCQNLREKDESITTYLNLGWRDTPIATSKLEEWFYIWKKSMETPNI